MARYRKRPKPPRRIYTPQIGALQKSHQTLKVPDQIPPLKDLGAYPFIFIVVPQPETKHIQKAEFFLGRAETLLTVFLGVIGTLLTQGQLIMFVPFLLAGIVVLGGLAHYHYWRARSREKGLPQTEEAQETDEITPR